MRKRNKGRKFGREKDQRIALFRSLARSLFIHERIKTTEAKGKELRPIVEKMITRAKEMSLANTRILNKDLSPKVAKKLINVIAPTFKTRLGGYTRIIKLGQRKSDAAPMVFIELVK